MLAAEVGHDCSIREQAYRSARPPCRAPTRLLHRRAGISDWAQVGVCFQVAASCASRHISVPNATEHVQEDCSMCEQAYPIQRALRSVVRRLLHARAGISTVMPFHQARMLTAPIASRRTLSPPADYGSTKHCSNREQANPAQGSRPMLRCQLSRSRTGKPWHGCSVFSAWLTAPHASRLDVQSP